MDNDKIQQLLATRALAEQELQKMRSAVTILFTDIKGSTEYFEKRGDVEGLAMVQRHNAMLIPVVEECGGRVVKTIGDAIMACFEDPVGGVKAAIGMQRALQADRERQPAGEQIHIRVGLHTGLGLVKDNDIFGDVVNAAARVQEQAEPDQILITDVLLDAARTAGVQCARLGRAEMRGKDEQIDIYAVAWSDSANQQLIEEIQIRFDAKLKDAKRQQTQTEEEFEAARDQWRAERRRLSAEIEELEESVERARSAAGLQVSQDIQSEIRFQRDEAVRSRQELEHELVTAQANWELERNNLKTELAALQGAAIEAMERSNNPTRLALAVREQVEARVADAREDWVLQWEGERRRLFAEIERLKNAGSAGDQKKEAVRRAVLEKLGKLPAGSAGSAVKSASQWENEFEEARIVWETERDQFKLKVQRLERELQQTSDDVRNEVFQEMRGQYEPKLAEANRERQRLQQELEALNSQFSEERLRLNVRIAQIEQAIPEAQEATRKQVMAEMKVEFDLRLEELNRLKSRAERRFQDDAEEWDAERRRSNKRISQLEDQLREAKEAAFKAQRLGSRTPSPEK